MKTYTVEKKTETEYVLYEIDNNSKQPVGRFKKRSEAEFHADIRSRVESGELK